MKFPRVQSQTAKRQALKSDSIEKGFRSLPRTLAILLLPALALGGCVERQNDEPHNTPTWVRYEIPDTNKSERPFVMRNLEVGGHIECINDGDAVEQKTEAYARVYAKQTGHPARVKKIRIQFEYLGGVMKGAIAKRAATDADWVSVSETLKIDFNGDAECSCVRIHGKMLVLQKYSPIKLMTLCPEET